MACARCLRCRQPRSPTRPAQPPGNQFSLRALRRAHADPHHRRYRVPASVAARQPATAYRAVRPALAASGQGALGPGRAVALQAEPLPAMEDRFAYPGKRLPVVLRGRRHPCRRAGHRRRRGTGRPAAARAPGAGHHQPGRLRRAGPAADRHPHGIAPPSGSTCSATDTTTAPPSGPGSADCSPAPPTCTRSRTHRTSTRSTLPPPGPSGRSGRSAGSCTPGATRCGTCGGPTSSTAPGAPPAEDRRGLLTRGFARPTSTFRPRKPPPRFRSVRYRMFPEGSLPAWHRRA